MHELLRQAPMNFPEKFPPCALLASNAAKDIYVPPNPSREFSRVLQPYYSDDPERLKYVEYAESGHFMREQDWNDLWDLIIFWFEKYL